MKDYKKYNNINIIGAKEFFHVNIRKHLSEEKNLKLRRF
jgi:hypothetical protein